MITPIGLQFSPRAKKGSKCCSSPSFGINPGELSKEGEKTVTQAASELGSVLIREAKKRVKQVKEEAAPIIKEAKKQVKGAMEKASQKLQEGAGKIKVDE